MSEFNPTEVEGLESGVNPQKEDAGISEDRITDQDRVDIDDSNIVDGDRNRNQVNYAEADAQADKAVEETAGISTE